MKFSLTIAVCFLLKLWGSSTQADTSLTLKNKQYLPPPIQQLPINEQYFNTQEQQKFQEKNYGNTRYRIFEVHNHYKTSTGREGYNKPKSLDKQLRFANNNYKNSAKKILIEHVNAPANFPLDDPNLDVSYLSFVAGNDDSLQKIFVQHETQNNIPVPVPSNFHHTFPEKSHRESNLNTVPQSYSSMQADHSQRYEASKFRGPDYLPPKSEAQQYFTHQEQNSQTARDYQTIRQQDHLRTPELSSHQIVNDNKVIFKGPDYLPPQHHLQNSEYKGPDYLPPHQQGREEVQHRFEPNVAFKGPDYLPPQQHFSSQYHKNLKQTSSLRGLHYERQYPPGLEQFEQNFISKSQFKGPDYLPPQTPSQEQNKQFTPSEQFNDAEFLPLGNTQELNKNNLNRGSDNLQTQHETKHSHSPFKGPDYLPPHQSQSNFKGLDYLPPARNQLQQQQVQILPTGYDFQKPSNAEQAIEELHKLPEESPVSEIPSAAKQKEIDSNDNNLPPGYDFKKPDNSERAIKLLHSQDTPTPSSIQFTKGTERSLPVYHFQRSSKTQNIENQLQNFDSPQQHFGSEKYGLANGLTTTYDLQKPVNAGQAINTLQRSENSYKDNQLHVTHNNKNYQVPAQNNQATNFADQTNANGFLQAYKGPDYLPPSEGSQKFKGPEYLPPSSEYMTSKGLDYTSGKAMFKGPEYLPPTTGAKNYKGPDYLPPLNSQTTEFSSTKAENFETFKGSDYLPPENKQQSYQRTAETQFKGPDYLPPSEHNTIVMYPLSNYMRNIQPNERYGNRRPFPEYGPPPAKTTTFSTNNDIAPMYRQPTLKPQYYAPTMSYTHNTYNIPTERHRHQTSSSLNQQARQTLQTFMPEEIRQTTPTNNIQVPNTAYKTTTTLEVTKPAKAKIRTVQIVNPNAIKTLKVLESLDDAGVKTLKILGSSNESPMGDHRVVKVVSGNNEQSVQTVKIFNDHQDVTPIGNNVSTVDASNIYLPPRTKRDTKSKSKA